jgi:hypothetical protein
MKIYFASGKVETVDMTKLEFDKMIEKMKMGGLRFVLLPNGTHVPLNSNTIEFIDSEGHGRMRTPRPELTVEQQIDNVKEEIAQTKEKMATEIGILDRENPSLTQKLEENPITGAEREKEILAKIFAKSDCTHDGDKLKLYKSSGKKGDRYFHSCSFCNWRSKFVKAESLTDEQKSGALQFSC